MNPQIILLKLCILFWEPIWHCPYLINEEKRKNKKFKSKLHSCYPRYISGDSIPYVSHNATLPRCCRRTSLSSGTTVVYLILQHALKGKVSEARVFLHIKVAQSFLTKHSIGEWMATKCLWNQQTQYYKAFRFSLSFIKFMATPPLWLDF